MNCPHPTVFSQKLWHPSQLRRSWYLFFFQLPLIPEWLISRDHGALVPKAIAGASRDRSRLTRQRLAPFAENFSSWRATSRALAYYRTAVRAALWQLPLGKFPRLPQIRAPFRLVWCEEDVALGKELTLGYEPYFTHPVDVRYVPGVGHFGNLEAPDLVGPLIVDHLKASP